MKAEINVDGKFIGVEVEKSATDDEKVDALRKIFRLTLVELFSDRYSLAIVKVTRNSDSGISKI